MIIDRTTSQKRDSSADPPLTYLYVHKSRARTNAWEDSSNVAGIINSPGSARGRGGGINNNKGAAGGGGSSNAAAAGGGRAGDVITSNVSWDDFDEDDEEELKFYEQLQVCKRYRHVEMYGHALIIL